MANFVLVHGSSHGAWCWRDVVPLLQAAGHTARAIDLPCHGDDQTPVKAASMDRYVDTILNALDGPTILVGHSLAGMFISQAGERDPSNISRLVYVCAWLPSDGQTTRTMRDGATSNPLADVIRFTDDRLCSYFDADKVEAHFYHDCPAGTLEFARENLCPEPLEPQLTPVRLGANFAGLNKSYVVGKHDRAIAPLTQMRFAQSLPPQDRYEMDCAHSPFFAQPAKLMEILMKIVEDQ